MKIVSCRFCQQTFQGKDVVVERLFTEHLINLHYDKIHEKLQPIVKDSSVDEVGIRFMSYLDSVLFSHIKNAEERIAVIKAIEDRLKENDWIEFSDATTFQKTFRPTRK